MASGYYMYGSKMSYVDYLTASEFVADINAATKESGKRLSMDISRQTRDIISSNEALSRENVRAVELAAEATAENTRMIYDSANMVSRELRAGFEEMAEGLDSLSNSVSQGFGELSGAMSAGFAQISYVLQQVSADIGELNATFHWGFGQLFASMGRMNDSLSELIKIAKTPAQTAAYEQYEIARDAFRQGLYLECLESLEKAITGDSASSGYKLEWRFHQMKGTVLLGFVGGDMSLVDLVAAEESFLLAARYAKTDYPDHAAQAFLSAGWAAYCQGKMKEALAHTEQAITINSGLVEALFQTAKIKMAMNEVDAALPILGQLIEKDRFYALKAAGDGDFQRHDKELHDFLTAMRDEKFRQIAEPFEKIKFWRENSHEAKSNQSVRQLEQFLIVAKAMPLFDLLNIFTEIETLLASVLSNTKGSLVIKVYKGQGVDCTWNEHALERKIEPIETSYEFEEDYIVEEQQPTEEIYEEEVIVKPAGFFRKAVTELQTKTRIVMKLTQVRKTRMLVKTRTDERVLEERYCKQRRRELNTATMEIYDSQGEILTKFEFCLIPAGTFIMGDEQNGPIHQVTITRDFYLGKFQVTQAQWEAVMGSNPSYFKNANNPVERVSWDDCQELITKLNKFCANKTRLPTEAEWEYACRAGSKSKYSFGNEDTSLNEYAWYAANSGETTHPVGMKKANIFRVYDMHGNVREWCHDWIENYTSEAQTDPLTIHRGHEPVKIYDKDTWIYGGYSSQRINRGGGYNSPQIGITSSARSGYLPTNKANDCGIRLVLTIE